MQRGRLRDRVTFQQQVKKVDGFGDPTGPWRDMAVNGMQLKDWPAEVRAISGREFFSSNLPQSDVTLRVTCEYCSELLHVTPVCRIKHGDLYYDIRAPLPDPVKREIVFMCTQHSVSA